MIPRLRFKCVLAVMFLHGCDGRSRNETSQTVPISLGKEKKVVSLSSNAVTKLHGFLAESKDNYVRLTVIGDNTDGFKYDLKLDDSPLADGDLWDSSHGVKVVTDARSRLYVEGTRIDWETRPDGREGFAFDNPNAISP